MNRRNPASRRMARCYGSHCGTRGSEPPEPPLLFVLGTHICILRAGPRRFPRRNSRGARAVAGPPPDSDRRARRVREAVHGRKEEETGHRRNGTVWTKGCDFGPLAGGVRLWAALWSFRPRKTFRPVLDGGYLAGRRSGRAPAASRPLNRLFSSASFQRWGQKRGAPLASSWHANPPVCFIFPLALDAIPGYCLSYSEGDADVGGL